MGAQDCREEELGSSCDADESARLSLEAETWLSLELTPESREGGTVMGLRLQRGEEERSSGPECLCS